MPDILKLLGKQLTPEETAAAAQAGQDRAALIEQQVAQNKAQQEQQAAEEKAFGELPLTEKISKGVKSSWLGTVGDYLTEAAAHATAANMQPSMGGYGPRMTTPAIQAKQEEVAQATKQALTDESKKYYQQSEEAGRGGHGFLFEMGQMLPQVGELSAVAGSHALNPQVGATADALYLSKMFAQSSGSARKQYQDYKASIGEEINPLKEDMVALFGGIAEVGAERLLGGITRYMPKNVTRGLTSTMARKVLSNMDDAMMNSALRNFATAYPGKMKTVMMVAAGKIDDAIGEMGEESVTEALNLLSESLYKEAADRPDLKEIIERELSASKGGAMLSLMMGPTQGLAQRYAQNKMRTQNGVHIAVTPDGKAFEVMGVSDGIATGATPMGEQVQVPVADIADQAYLSNAEFKEYMAGLKKGQDQAKKEQVYSMVNPSTGMLEVAHTIHQKHEEEPGIVILSQDEATGLSNVIFQETGEKKFIKTADINQNTRNSIDPQQYLDSLSQQEQAEQGQQEMVAPEQEQTQAQGAPINQAPEQQAAPTQAPQYNVGDTVAINGTIGVVTDAMGTEVAIETEQGPITANVQDVKPTVSITDGKTQYPAVENEDGSLLVGTPIMDAGKATKTAENLNKIYNGKRSFDVQPIPSNDPNIPDSYQIVAMPSTQAPEQEAQIPSQEVQPTATQAPAPIAPQTAGTAPVYRVGGNEVSKGYVKGRIRAAESKEDIADIETDDAEIAAMVEAKWPTPVQSYSFNGEAIDRDEALGIIEGAKNADSIKGLVIENDSELQEALQSKFQPVEQAQPVQPTIAPVVKPSVAPVAEKERTKKETKKETTKAKSRTQRILSQDPVSLEHSILQYFIAGGKFKPSWFYKEIIPKERGGAKEVSLRRFMASEEKGFEQADNPFADVDGQVFRDTLIGILTTHSSLSQMMASAEAMTQDTTSSEDAYAEYLAELEYEANEYFYKSDLTEEEEMSYIETEREYNQIIANEQGRIETGDSGVRGQDEQEVQPETTRDSGTPDLLQGRGMATDGGQVNGPSQGTGNILGGTASQLIENRATTKEIAREAAVVENNPTEAQKEAGNYKKGHVNIQGLDITIENPQGSVRTGTDSDGETWETTMNNHYGYFKRTEGKDGDQVDVFIGESPLSETVFIVDQVDPKTGEFDEHKVMLGFNNQEEATAAYNSNYSEGWKGLGAITEMAIDEFKSWLKDGKRTKEPAAYYHSNIDAKDEAAKGPMSREEVANEYRREAIDRELNIANVPPVAFNHLRQRFGMYDGELGQITNSQMVMVDEAEKTIRQKLKLPLTKEEKADRKMREQFEKVKRDQEAFRNQPQVDNWTAKEEEVANERANEAANENTLVSNARYEELKARLKGKLGNLNAGFDPELALIGAEMAAYHIERGARKFVDFAKSMIEDLGDNIRPYLKMFYMSAKNMPGLNTEGMDKASFVEDFNLDELTIEEAGAATTEQAPQLSEKQQSDLDKALADIDKKIEEQQTRRSNAIKGREKKYAEVNKRNGLFGDTSQDPKQGTLFAADLVVNRETISNALAPFEKEVKAAEKEMDRLMQLREDTIENAGAQQELFDKQSDKTDISNKKDVHNRPGSSKSDSPRGGAENINDAGLAQGDRGTSGDARGEVAGRVRGDSGQSATDITPSFTGTESDSQIQEETPSDDTDVAGNFDGRGRPTTGTDGNAITDGGGSTTDSKPIAGSFRERQVVAKKKQEEAEKIPVSVMDEANIRKTLPFLLSEQQDDVLKAETRFFDPEQNKNANGKGMLFTNGTGTGKTYTGLGIVKRFVKQGKKNILIVTPSQPKVNDWANDGKNLGLDIMQLPDTSTGGEGVVVTTFANFRENPELLKRDFDLVVYDESHRLMEDKKGQSSSTTGIHYLITNKNEWTALQRLQSFHPLWVEEKKLVDAIRQEGKSRVSLDTMEQVYFASLAKEEELTKQFAEVKEKQKEVLPELEAKAKELVQKTKVVFLSATPFKGHFNLRYVNEYLFDWGGETTYEGHSRVDPESRFFLDNFGGAYQWRYHRLEQKGDANADAVAMQEVQFAEKLMSDGVMSGRTINSEQDYAREFPKVAGEFMSEEFNKAFGAIFDYQGNEFDLLRESAREVFFNYNYTTQLFEALKTSMSIDRMRKHLDLGRKIVVFHRRQQSNVAPPFASVVSNAKANASAVLASKEADAEQKATAKRKIEQARAFENKYKDLFEYEKGLNYNSAVSQIGKEFGERAAYVNGTVSTKEKNKAIANFNTDGSGVDIIVVQEDSGKEGISLHDTTGKHQRVLISLSMPISSVTALQIEGRTYRIGQESDSIFEYPLLGLDLETAYFGQNINKRLSTTENLAVGEQSRDLIRSFAEGVLFNSEATDPSAEQGNGGKEYDKREKETKTDFQKARLVYSTNQKQRAKRDSRKGIDWYATAEPLGQKVVEWGNGKEGDHYLEPSAGNGAIAMWVPKSAHLDAVEPAFELYSKLGARAGGGTKKLLNQTFEDLHLVNKYDVIAMNPPFGSGGKTAMDHLEKAFKHLRNGGRVVAIIPQGSMDKRLDKFLYGEDDKGKALNPDARLIASIKLPSVAFEQAGTSVSTRVVVIDKLSPEAETGPTKNVDLSHIKDINGLFDALEYLTVPNRTVVDVQQTTMPKTAGEFVSNIATAITEGQAYYKEQQHSKTGETLHTVPLRTRLERDQYDRLAKKAKEYGGYYSTWNKGGFTPSFIFKEKETADKFIEEANKATGSFKKTALRGPKARLDEVNRLAVEFSGKVANPSKVVAVQSREDLPEAMKGESKAIMAQVEGEKANIQAFYSPATDTIYYVADNLPKNREELFKVFAHEQLLHKGINMLIPDSTQRQILLKQVFDTIGEDAIREKIGDTYDAAPDHVKALEYLAHTAEDIMQEKDLTPAQESAWNSFVEKIKSLILKMFGRDVNFTTEELHSIIRASAQEVIGYIQTGEAAKGGLQGREQLGTSGRGNLYPDRSTWSIPSETNRKGRVFKTIKELILNNKSKDFDPQLFESWYRKLNEAGVNETYLALDIYENLPDIAFSEFENVKKKIEGYVENRTNKREDDTIRPIRESRGQVSVEEQYGRDSKGERPTGHQQSMSDIVSSAIEESIVTIPLHHATSNAFDMFDDRYFGGATSDKAHGEGHYFSDNKEHIQRYAGKAALKAGLYDTYRDGIRSELGQEAVDAFDDAITSNGTIESLLSKESGAESQKLSQYIASNPIPKVRVMMDVKAFKNMKDGDFNLLAWDEKMSDTQRTAIEKASDALPAEKRQAVREQLGKTGRDFSKSLFGIKAQPGIMSETEVRELMQSSGIDGIKAPKKNGSYIVIFDRDQTAIENIGYFKKGSLDEAFYSPTEKALDNISMGKATAQQWKAMLLKNGAKEAEMEWTGLNDLLEGNKSLTKDEVRQVLAENKVELSEVVKGSKMTPEEQRKFQEMEDNFDSLTGAEMYEWERLSNLADGDFSGDGGATKYSGYVTEGGKNYKEWLLTMPTGAGYLTVSEQKARLMKEYGVESWFDLTDVQKAELRNKDEKRPQPPTFKSSHWDEPNIVVHARTDEFTDTDGKKVLLVEELQSDWAQQGKKEGFSVGHKEKVIEDNSVFWVYNTDGKFGFVPKIKAKTEKEAIAYSKEHPEIFINETGQEGVSDMPFKQTPQWVSLAMRRMMKHAAENGFDKLAFVTGDQSADRYDLSKQASKIEYWKSDDAGYTGLSIYDKDGNVMTGYDATDFKNDELEGIIGKELASKILNDDYTQGQEVRSIEGDNLKIGGSGMKSFYDQIVPSVAKKVFKTKIGSTDIITGEPTQYDIDGGVLDMETGEVKEGQAKKPIVTVNAIDITPEMRESFSQAQPMFKKLAAESGNASEAMDRYARWKRNQGNHLEVIEKAKDAMGKFGVPINVVSSTEELPAHVRAKIERGDERRFQGAFDPRTGMTYLVSENITPEMTNRIITHEVLAHKGLRKILGKQFEAILKDVYSGMSETDKKNYRELYSYKKDGKTIEPTEAEIADEYIANIAEDYKRPAMLERVIAKVRGLLRKAFGIDYSRGDIMHLLSKSEDYYIMQDKPSLESYNSMEDYIQAIGEWNSLDNYDIRYKKTNDPADLQQRGDAFREKVQDRMITLKRLQEEVKKKGGKVDEMSNAYRQENLSYGRINSEFVRVNKELVQPIEETAAEIIKAKGSTLEEFQLYLKAKHAPERNEVISRRKQWPAIEKKVREEATDLQATEEELADMLAKARETFDSNPISATKQSGFETDEANKIVADYEKGLDPTVIDKLWSQINGLTEYTLNRWLQDGFITKGQYDNIKNMYSFYVPLRGHKDADTTWEYMNDNINKVLNPNKKAEGRESESEDPLQYMVNMANTAIVLGENNKVKQHAYRMAAANNMPEFFTVKKTWEVDTGKTDANGTPIYDIVAERPDQKMFDEGKVISSSNNQVKRIGIPKYQVKEHQVEVFINGTKHIVDFKNPNVARAINKENVAGSIPVLAPITRWMSANFTSKNPAFIPINTIRDISYAFAAHSVKGNPGDAKNFLKNLGKAEMAMRNQMKGKKGKYEDMYEEFMTSGGETGFIHLKDVDELKKELDKDIKRLTRQNSKLDKTARAALAITGLRKAGAMMEHFATRSENLSRFATYITARERGATPAQAASEAKEITVNFNRKGTHSNLLGSLYAFFNASLQGGENFARMGWENKGKFAAMSGTFMAIGFLNALAQMMNDDEEENDWDNISDYMKQNYVVVPYGKKNYISVPMPHGFRSFYALGVIAAEMMQGKREADKTAMDVLSTINSSVSPVDPTGLFEENKNRTYSLSLRPGIPTAVVPFYDVATNKDFAGRNIGKESYTRKQEETEARAGKYQRNVNKAALWMTDNWFKLGGGDPELYSKWADRDGKDRHVPEIFDVNPSHVEHLVESFTGGRGKFFNQLYKTGLMTVEAGNNAIKGENPLKDFDMNDVPIVSRLNRSAYENVYGRFYKLQDEVEINDMLNKEYEKIGKERPENPEMEIKREIIKTYEDANKELKEMEKEAEDNKEALESIKEERKKLMKELLKEAEL